MKLTARKVYAATGSPGPKAVLIEDDGHVVLRLTMAEAIDLASDLQRAISTSIHDQVRSR